MFTTSMCGMSCRALRCKSAEELIVTRIRCAQVYYPGRSWAPYLLFKDSKVGNDCDCHVTGCWWLRWSRSWSWVLHHLVFLVLTTFLFFTTLYSSCQLLSFGVKVQVTCTEPAASEPPGQTQKDTATSGTFFFRPLFSEVGFNSPSSGPLSTLNWVSK